MLFNLSDIRALSLFNTDPQTLTMMWQTVVLGMGMIFSVLGLLWAILAIGCIVAFLVSVAAIRFLTDFLKLS